jgi:thioredoxin reductase (NADPH)
MSAAITRPDLISAEVIEIYENQDLANALSSMAVPQTVINGAVTLAGLQPEPWFIEALLTLREPQTAPPRVPGETLEKDLVIIGGGPAGLTAAIYATRAGLNCVVVEKSNLGGQVAITPVVENYPGFMRIGGKSLVDLISQQAAQYSEVHVGEYVTEASGELKEGRFHLKTNHAIYDARAILIATGVGTRSLEAPGAQKFYGRGVSYCATCDGYFFKDGKKVIVVGGGNTAATEALYLKNIGVDVTIVHRRDRLRAELFLQESLTEQHIPILWNTELKEIRGEKFVTGAVLENVADKTTNTLPVDGVFVAIGYVPSHELAAKLGVATDDEGYIMVDKGHRTNVKGVYAAGDITGGFKQIVTAVGQGSLAATTIFEDTAHPYWKMGTAAS